MTTSKTPQKKNKLEESSNDTKEPAKKARGRPKNQNYVSWEEAREMLRAEMIPSRGKFFEWWDRNKPKSIPRFPYRVYVDEWTNWNDFLGTNNKFNEKMGMKWRPYDEAVLWVHSQKISSFPAWMEFCRTGNLPADIPARPELAYKKWISWNHWLGNRPVEAIQAKQQAQRVAVYYIIHEQGVPSNVITYGVEPMGLSALRERWNRERYDIVRLFWHDPEKQEMVDRIISHFSTPYLGMERQRITPNVWDIVYHVQNLLDVAKPNQEPSNQGQQMQTPGQVLD
jgi:hypothetical protein